MRTWKFCFCEILNHILYVGDCSVNGTYNSQRNGCAREIFSIICSPWDFNGQSWDWIGGNFCAPLLSTVFSFLSNKLTLLALGNCWKFQIYFKVSFLFCHKDLQSKTFKLKLKKVFIVDYFSWPNQKKWFEKVVQCPRKKVAKNVGAVKIPQVVHIRKSMMSEQVFFSWYMDVWSQCDAYILGNFHCYWCIIGCTHSTSQHTLTHTYTHTPPCVPVALTQWFPTRVPRYTRVSSAGARGVAN